MFVGCCLRFEDKLFSYYYLRHTFLRLQEMLPQLVLSHFKLLSSFFYSQIMQVPHKKDARTGIPSTTNNANYLPLSALD